MVNGSSGNWMRRAGMRRASGTVPAADRDTITPARTRHCRRGHASRPARPRHHQVVTGSVAACVMAERTH